MPLLYLAKVNLNSNIFEIYDKTLDLKVVLKKIYREFAIGTTCSNRNKERYWDSMGNLIEYMRESNYSFQEIQKLDKGIITGKLVRKFNRPSEKLDSNTNKMVQTSVQEMVSIYFYYDVYREMITFCERQSFGYNQFMGAFTYLLNKIATPYEFEIFLQKDREILEEKLKNLISVRKVKATLIPPNSNEDDLKELRNELIYMQQCQDANAIKMDLSYTSSNMNMESKVMKDIKTAVSRGYGDVNATGVNENGKIQTVKSSKDAAYTVNIQDNIKEMDFNEESRNMISRFIEKITSKRFSKKEEPNTQ